MLVYGINIFLIMLMYFFCSVLTTKPKMQDFISTDKIIARLLSISFLSMWIVMTLRGTNVGFDTNDYYNGFLRIQSISWQQIFDFSQQDLVYNYERGFIILSKLFTIVSQDYTIYLGFLSALILIPVYYIIKIYSPDPFLSLILFIALGFYHFDMSGLRQGIAVSLGLFSFGLLDQKKYMKFLLLILITSTIHSSALVLTIAILLINLKLTKFKKTLYYCLTVFLFLFRVPIYEWVIVIMGEGTKIANNTGAYTLFFVVTVAFAAALVFYKRTVECHPNNISLIYNLTAIGATLMIFNTISYWSLRLTNYFYIFMILLIPFVVASVKDKRVQFIYKMIILIFVLTYYFTSGYKYLGTGDYTFFWEW